MNIIYKAFDGAPFDTFKDCFTYELEHLGILLFDEEMKLTDDYEKTFHIYIPRAEYARIVIDWADCPEIDDTLWKFNDDCSHFEDDTAIIYNWNSFNDTFEVEMYDIYAKIVGEVNGRNTKAGS